MNTQPIRRRALVSSLILLAATFLPAMVSSVDAQGHAADPDVQAAAQRVTQIIAHRGASAERPECTLAALRRAMEVGATAVEVDVRTSRDGELFVLHDETLDRTTNGSGPANALTLADLQQLDAGSWFDPKYRGERVPSLIQAAQECRGRIDLLLDLKEQGDDYDRKVVDIIQKHGDPEKTIVGVRTVAQAERFRRLLPKSKQLGLIPSVDSIESFAEVGVDTIRLWPRWLQGGDGPVKRVRESGKRLHLNGTLGEPDETLALLTFGPDSLSSDHPARLKKTLEGFAEASISDVHDGLPPAPDGSFSISEVKQCCLGFEKRRVREGLLPVRRMLGWPIRGRTTNRPLVSPDALRPGVRLSWPTQYGVHVPKGFGLPIRFARSRRVPGWDGFHRPELPSAD